MTAQSDKTNPTPKRAWSETVKIVRERAENCCEQCHKPEGLCIKINNRWQTIHLQIYHIDGDTRNDDLNNLRYLCPICAKTYDAKAQREREAREQRLRDAQLTFDF